MTKEEIKTVTTVSEVLARYGVEVRRGRCKAICHNGTHYTAKVSDELYYCFKCNKSMDIFDIVMFMDNCNFQTAFERLGGRERPSFRTYIKANKAKRELEQRKLQEDKDKSQIKQIHAYITAYRDLINETEPFSDLWCYCQNKLQYQLYLLESFYEKR